MKDEAKRSGRSEPSEEPEKNKRDWSSRNGPVLAVVIGVLVIAAMGVAMKTCG